MKKDLIQFTIVDKYPSVIDLYKKYMKFPNWETRLSANIFLRDLEFGMKTDALLIPSDGHYLFGGIAKTYVEVFGKNEDTYHKLTKGSLYDESIHTEKVVIIETTLESFPHFIIFPSLDKKDFVTERDIRDSMLSVFKHVEAWNSDLFAEKQIKSLVLPAIGASIDTVNPKQAARAIFRAYTEFISPPRYTLTY